MRSGGSIAPSPYFDYEAQCLLWRQSLSEENLRALTTDFLMGRHDHATRDALAEYEERYGPIDRTNGRGLPKKEPKSKRSAKRRSSRYK